MSEQTKHKSPEELGEAVGRKIEEIFGGMFQDEAPGASEVQPLTAAEPKSAELSGPVSQPSAAEPARTAPDSGRTVQAAPARSEAARTGAPSKSGPATVGLELGKPANSFAELIEQIEAVVLNLEWEVSQKSVSDLTRKLGEVERFIPNSGIVRNILEMHRRVLARFNSPEAAPHPALMKLLQNSVAAFRSLHTSRGKGPLPKNLSEAVTQSYRIIMATPTAGLVKARKTDRAEAEHRAHTLQAMIADAGNAVRSLEEVSQRLARILGVARKGGNLSGDEMTRRLGTLEKLLSDRVGQLSAVQKALAHEAESLDDNVDRKALQENRTRGEGLLMLLWGGMPLAIPFSAVVAALPLTKAQAEQFKDKSTITLGAASIPRLPLKRPESPSQTGPNLPGWLIHLSWDGKNFFLLADRSLGYRQAPQGVDLGSQSKIKIGATFYTVLHPARFR